MIQTGKDDATKVINMGEGAVFKKLTTWKTDKALQEQFSTFEDYLYQWKKQIWVYFNAKKNQIIFL